MKKLLPFLFLAMTSIARADSKTPRLGLTIPTIGSPTWGQKINGNFQILDATAVAGSIGLLAVGTGTANNFTTTITSITYGISFRGDQFSVATDTNNRTAYVTSLSSGGGGGGGTPGGSNTNVQFNNSGSFGGDSGFQYDNSVSSVSLGGFLGLKQSGQTGSNHIGRYFGTLELDSTDDPNIVALSQNDANGTSVYSYQDGRTYILGSGINRGQLRMNDSVGSLSLGSLSLVDTTSTSNPLFLRFELNGLLNNSYIEWEPVTQKFIIPNSLALSGLAQFDLTTNRSSFTSTVVLSSSVMDGSNSVGTSGQVLTSRGTGTYPTWQTPSASGGGGGIFFNEIFGAAQADLVGGAQPFISNSTNETTAGIYFDDTSTQAVRWSLPMKNWSGGQLSADIIFTSTATSGVIDWGIYTSTFQPNTGSGDFDTRNFVAIVTTSVVMNSVSNSLQQATVVLSNTVIQSSKTVTTFKLEREAGAADDTAVGFGRVKFIRVYESTGSSGSGGGGGSGTITGVTAGNGLTGGGTSGTVTLTVDPSTVTLSGVLVAGSNITLTPSGGQTTISATGGGGGGASSLEVFNNFNGARSSPTASIGMSQAFLGSVSASTFTFALNFSSVASKSDLTKFFYSTGVYVASTNVTSALTVTANGTSGSTPQFGVNFSSVVSQSDLTSYMTQSSSTLNDLKLSSAAATYLNKNTITSLSPGVMHIVKTSSNVVTAQVDLSTEVIGNLPVTNLNSGTGAGSSTFWRGDGTWATPAGGGGSGASTLGVFNDATLISSPTSAFNFPNLGGLISSLQGSSTAQVSINFGSTNTWTGGQTFLSPISAPFGNQTSERFGNSAGNSLSNNGFNTQDTAIGYGALQALTTGAFNTAVGAEALNALKNTNNVGDNTAIGASALGSIVSDRGNTAVGSHALAQLNFVGSSNTVVGYFAGDIGTSAPTLANGVTYIGYNAGSSTNGLSNVTCIGYNCAVSSSNIFMLGNGSENVVIPSTAILQGPLAINGNAGTSGQILQSNGAGSVPSWVTSSGGVSGSSNGTLFAMTISSSVTNSSAETNIVGVGSGTVTLPANYLVAGKTIRVKSSGLYISTTNAGNMTIKFKLGSTIIVSTASFPLVDNQTNQLWSFGVALTCRSSGSSGSVIANTAFGMFDGTNGWRTFPMVNTAPITVDTTISQDVVLTAQFSLANASNTFTNTNFVVASETVTTVGASPGGGGGSSVYPATGTITGNFYQPLYAGAEKLPGSNAPYVSNSTNELTTSDYFDDTSTQSVSWTFRVHNYGGKQLYADVVFHSTATSNYVCWGLYTSTMTPNVYNVSQDAPVYSVVVTTAIAMSGTALSPKSATATLSNTTIHNGDILTVILERETGGCSNTEAVGYARETEVDIYEQ